MILSEPVDAGLFGRLEKYFSRVAGVLVHYERATSNDPLVEGFVLVIEANPEIRETLNTNRFGNGVGLFNESEKIIKKYTDARAEKKRKDFEASEEGKEKIFLSQLSTLLSENADRKLVQFIAAQIKIYHELKDHFES